MRNQINLFSGFCAILLVFSLFYSVASAQTLFRQCPSPVYQSNRNVTPEPSKLIGYNPPNSRANTSRVYQAQVIHSTTTVLPYSISEQPAQTAKPSQCENVAPAAPKTPITPGKQTPTKVKPTQPVTAETKTDSATKPNATENKSTNVIDTNKNNGNNVTIGNATKDNNTSTSADTTTKPVDTVKPENSIKIDTPSIKVEANTVEPDVGAIKPSTTVTSPDIPKNPFATDETDTQKTDDIGIGTVIIDEDIEAETPANNQIEQSVPKPPPTTNDLESDFKFDTDDEATGSDNTGSSGFELDFSTDEPSGASSETDIIID
ncbi:MAG: hypothetical protein ACRC2T_04375, partial [Thermoguttaceae bacterium]